MSINHFHPFIIIITNKTTSNTLFFVTTLFSQTIEVVPDSIAVTLVSGDSTEVALTVSNTGSAELEYAVAGDFLLVEFTNCGATGRNGPSQSDCNSIYSGTQLED